MAPDRCSAGAFDAKKQFRHVDGSLHLEALRTALEQQTDGERRARCDGTNEEIAA
jgi:hypothetical protein